MPLQTYKTNTNATGARCEANDTTKSKLLLAGIVLAGVVLLALLFAAIMFYRYGRPTHLRIVIISIYRFPAMLGTYIVTYSDAVSDQRLAI